MQKTAPLCLILLVRAQKGLQQRAYPISLNDLPVSTENVFHNYNETVPAIIDFELANGNQLQLFFPERGACYLIPTAQGRLTRSPSDFKKDFNLTITLVPVLGPVDHNEKLYQKETARLSLMTQGASRNFRNIWYHYPDGFAEFRKTIQETWPGMDIEKPEVDHSNGEAILHMFCPEERFPREIYWAGFGFQVWCQMVTFILQARQASTLVIDEPDIYLHSDLQRQLVEFLQALGPQVILATHSVEIISEVESNALLNVNACSAEFVGKSSIWFG